MVEVGRRHVRQNVVIVISLHGDYPVEVTEDGLPIGANRLQVPDDIFASRYTDTGIRCESRRPHPKC